MIALGGFVALAAAMGLGRFLYTPVLPMMAGAGLGPAEAGLVASANFAGYLAGALAASLPGLSRHARGLMLGALVASALTTGAMAGAQALWLWAALRFAGGVASAFVLVLASSLIVARLNAAGRGGLAAVHFAGVGAGIVVSALIASPVLATADAWRQVWLSGGALALTAAGVAALMVPAAPGAARGPRANGAARAPGLWRLVAAYAALGFGYVVTATFIVAILREGPSGRLGETVVWLIVGLAAIPSVWLWTRAGARWGVVRAYRAAMLVEAAGVGLSAVATGTAALAFAAAALGGTFMGLTALGLQEAARRAGGDGRAVMGLMTAAFGLGQMAGPAIAGWMRDASGSYAGPSLIAAAVLVAGALILAPLARGDAPSAVKACSSN
ncbi:YbfB/YjiJ family MFS transporter [Limibaculum sp. FT325]|uniref:YbfB/YjiJ family MFS transporter n=1 Tax=Thermohalobaculum sediminis TaxID=2939436 RepID=UPI0020C16362|nr:YbfB/YjiJ family MFS transporter [Limibaculum sediminis]MCL5776674.1 YbfB/YjiJ family MFS transporter [Limibaculum sediminis]